MVFASGKLYRERMAQFESQEVNSASIDATIQNRMITFDSLQPEQREMMIQWTMNEKPR